MFAFRTAETFYDENLAPMKRVRRRGSSIYLHNTTLCSSGYTVYDLKIYYIKGHFYLKSELHVMP